MIDAETIRAALGPLSLDSAELQELAGAMRCRPPAAIRLRSGCRASELPFRTSPVPWHDGGLLVADGARPGAQLAYAAGDYYIQDAASLLPVALLDVQPGELVCDLCAAPGGKATAVLEDLGQAGWLLANEAIRSRLGPLRLNLARHGLPRFAVSQLDPARLAESLGAVFDAVLVDAPCSGQSLVARGKQTAAAFSPSAIEHCAARQARILDAAIELVRPGGRLVYSTCTLSYAENEAQVERLLRRQPNWSAAPAAAGLAAHQSPGHPGCYRLWPQRDGCGGAFASALRRTENGPVEPPARSHRAGRGPLSPTGLPAGHDDWGTLSGAFLAGNPQQCFAWPEPVWPALLQVAVSGPEVAFRKRSAWFPAYALAMRRTGDWSPAATTALDDQQARAYVQGLTLASGDRGWRVAQWNGRPLGWLKGDGKTLKNHLPKPARLAVG